MAEDRQNLWENLFGFSLRSPKEEIKRKEVLSPFPPVEDDGALTIMDGAGAYSASFLDYGRAMQNEVDLISKYRAMALHPVVVRAIDNIFNDMISFDADDQLVDLDLDELLDVSDNLKSTIRDEFRHILDLLKFRRNGYNTVRKWYVDGRLYYHVMVDIQRPELGIQEVRNIDPRKIKLVKKERKSATTSHLVRMHERFEEFYLYNPNAASSVEAGFKIAKDAIVYAHSGMMDETGAVVLSQLHMAMKILNMMKWMEDSLVIYRLIRAAERRVFTIDVGDVPPAKAKAYIEGIMNQHKNKMMYDPATGQVDTEKRFLTMHEDFYLPQRDGKGTSVTQLAGGQNLSDITDVEYFRKQLYEALNVPASRLENDALFSSGRTSEITRDEVNYQKFIDRQREQFATLFLGFLRVQLILKGVCSLDQWKKWESLIRFDYKKDNFFAEFKDLEVEQQKIAVLGAIDPFVQKYYSAGYVKREILKQTEDEIEALDLERQQEEATGEAAKFGMGMGMGMDDQFGPPPFQDATGFGGPPPDFQGDPQDADPQGMMQQPVMEPKPPRIPRRNKKHAQPPKGPPVGESRRFTKPPTRDALALGKVLAEHANLNSGEFVTLSTPLRKKS